MLGLAFGAGLGAPGLWLGLSAGLTATAIYLVVRFIQGTWTPKVDSEVRVEARR